MRPIRSVVQPSQSVLVVAHPLLPWSCQNGTAHRIQENKCQGLLNCARPSFEERSAALLVAGAPDLNCPGVRTLNAPVSFFSWSDRVAVMSSAFVSENKCQALVNCGTIVAAVRGVGAFKRPDRS